MADKPTVDQDSCDCGCAGAQSTPLQPQETMDETCDCGCANDK